MRLHHPESNQQSSERANITENISLSLKQQAAETVDEMRQAIEKRKQVNLIPDVGELPPVPTASIRPAVEAAARLEDTLEGLLDYFKSSPPTQKIATATSSNDDDEDDFSSLFAAAKDVSSSLVELIDRSMGNPHAYDNVFEQLIDFSENNFPLYDELVDLYHQANSAIRTATPLFSFSRYQKNSIPNASQNLGAKFSAETKWLSEAAALQIEFDAKVEESKQKLDEFKALSVFAERLIARSETDKEDQGIMAEQIRAAKNSAEIIKDMFEMLDVEGVKADLQYVIERNETRLRERIKNEVIGPNKQFETKTRPPLQGILHSANHEQNRQNTVGTQTESLFEESDSNPDHMGVREKARSQKLKKSKEKTAMHASAVDEDIARASPAMQTISTSTSTTSYSSIPKQNPICFLPGVDWFNIFFQIEHTGEFKLRDNRYKAETLFKGEGIACVSFNFDNAEATPEQLELLVTKGIRRITTSGYTIKLKLHDDGLCTAMISDDGNLGFANEHPRYQKMRLMLAMIEMVTFICSFTDTLNFWGEPVMVAAGVIYARWLRDKLGVPIARMTQDGNDEPVHLDKRSEEYRQANVFMDVIKDNLKSNIMADDLFKQIHELRPINLMQAIKAKENEAAQISRRTAPKPQPAKSSSTCSKESLASLFNSSEELVTESMPFSPSVA